MASTVVPSEGTGENNDNNDHLIRSADSKHPANLIPELCANFYRLGWVTGTG
jgi:methylthioribulose-1-phosphate dehydratase